MSAANTIPPPTYRPTCPRCHYDLTGLINSWHDLCPLTDTCSECGLPLDWRTILNPRYHHVPGLYEHAPRWWNLSWTWRTWTWCILPHRFMSRLARAPLIRFRRIILWLILLYAPLLFLRGSLMMIGALFYISSQPPSPIDTPRWVWLVNAFAWPVGFLNRFWLATTNRYIVIWTWTPTFFGSLLYLSLFLLPPLTLFALARTTTGPRPDPRQLARLTLYSLAWCILPLLLFLGIAGTWAANMFWLNTFGRLLVPGSPFERFISPLVTGPILLTWLAAWWWSARRTLNLRRPLLMWTIAILTSWTCATLALIWTDLGFDLMSRLQKL